MKVLIIEGRKTIGGGQVVTKYICNELSKEYEIEVFIPGNSNSTISTYLNQYKQYYFKTKEYTLGKKKLIDYAKFFYNLISSGFYLYKTLKISRPDYIYIQHVNMLPITILINHFFKIKIITHIHVIHSDNKTRRLINYLLTSKQIKRVIGVSQFSLSQFTEKVKKKSVVIYNPVELRETYHPDLQKLNIAIIGDVYNSKGQHVLLESFNEKKEDYKIHIIGNIIDPNYKKYLEQHFNKTNVVYTGMINDVANYLKQNKIAITVIASIVKFETFSLAMVESWAQGIPTIATNDFGMKELTEKFLPQYKNLLLFPLGNSKILHDKILELTADKKRYQEISLTLRQTVKLNFNKQSFSEKIKEILRNC